MVESRQEFRTSNVGRQSAATMETQSNGGGYYVISQNANERQTGHPHPQGYRMVDRNMSPTVTRTRIVERTHRDQIAGDQDVEEVQYIVEDRD